MRGMGTAADRVRDELLDTVVECFTPDVAAQVAALRISPMAQQRLDQLAQKNSAGRLSDDEQQEHSAYVEAIDVIAILQAKARNKINEVALHHKADQPRAKIRSPQLLHKEQIRDFRKRVLAHQSSEKSEM